MVRQCGGFHTSDAHLRKPFSERVRELRKERGMSAEKVIAETGISETSYERLERGDGIPNLTNLCLIAEKLNASID